MTAFDMLALPDARILWGFEIKHVVSTNLVFPLAIEEYVGGPLIDFSSGYTASMTLNRKGGINVVTITNVLTSGLVIDLNPPEDGASLVIRGTAAGARAVLEPHVDRRLAFNLRLVRTSDLFAVDVMRDCAVYPLPAHD